MQRENQNKQHKAGEEKKEGYVVIPNYFLREWVRVLGVGPIDFVGSKNENILFYLGFLFSTYIVQIEIRLQEILYMVKLMWLANR